MNKHELIEYTANKLVIFAMNKKEENKKYMY